MNRGLAAVVILVVLAVAPDAGAGLVARYSIDSLPDDGSVADSSGNSLNGGARLGDAIVDGRFGGAIRLAGGVGYGFNVANHSLLEPRRLTVATWARKGGPFHVFRTVVGKGGVGCSSSTWALYTAANGGLSFYVNTRDANGQPAPLQTPPIPPEQIWNDQWHAIAGTFDGTEVALWVDGVKVASAEYPGRPVQELDYAAQVSEKRLQIGRYDEAGCSAAGFQFYGDVDEVRLYDRVLSNPELATLQDPAATEPPVIPDPPPAAVPDSGADTSFVAVPLAKTDARLAYFVVSASKAGASYECSLDSGPFGPCPAQYTTPSLKVGNHSLSARAVVNGIPDPTPAIYRWTITVVPKDTVLSRGSCTAAAHEPGVSSFTAFLLHPEPADLKSGSLIPQARWWCTAAAGTCPTDMLCRGTATVNVIDTFRYYAFGQPLYGAAGTCWHDPSASATSYRLDCYDDLACFANAGRCTNSGPLWLGLLEQQVKGGQPFWTRCSYGFSARATYVLPDSGSVTCSATYTGSKPNLGIQAGALVSTSKLVKSSVAVLLPATGTVTIAGSVGSRLNVRATATKQTPAIGTTTVKVKQAGRVQAVLKLNKAAQTRLRRTGRMTITLLVRFQPAAGGPEQTRVTTQTLRASIRIKGKRCPKSAKTKRARAKCVTLPKFPKAKKT